MQHFKRFERNSAGTDYAVGDIHGCFARLLAKLSAIGFDPTKDRLFSVGDLVDRGPDNEQAESWVAFPWFHAVTGNHDDMAKRWPNGHMDRGNYSSNGGEWNIRRSPDAQRSTAEAFSALPLAIEVDTENGPIGIVHADCPRTTWSEFRSLLLDPTLSNNRLSSLEAVAMWDRNRITYEDSTGVPDLHAMIVGHTPVQRYTCLGNVYYIDTGAVFGRDFTILNLNTLKPA